MTKKNSNDFLTETMKEAQPLLMSLGVIITPPEIDDAFYKEMAWAISLGRKAHPRAKLRILCCGHGGWSYQALGIGDLLSSDGNIIGILNGYCASAHGIIWASCPERLVYPHATLGVHLGTYSELKEVNAVDVMHNYETLQWIDHRVASLYASISTEDVDYWKGRIRHAPGSLDDIHADELVEMGMARHVDDWLAEEGDDDGGQDNSD